MLYASLTQTLFCPNSSTLFAHYNILRPNLIKLRNYVSNTMDLFRTLISNIALYKDRLDEIFKLQKGLSEIMKLDRYPKDVEGRVSALCTAIMHEAVELQRTTNWKWWKTPTEFNQNEAREELIDIWHFVVQASLELKLTPDDILEEYKRKNQINHERQKNGY